MSPAAVFVLLFLALPPVGAPDTFTAVVTAVHDGDTITVSRARLPVKIRLEGIDCPESGQAFGQHAKHFTEALVFRKTVTVNPRSVDRYGRLVARVLVDGQDVSLALVQAGFAWHYTRYSRDAALAGAEKAARAQRVGLWREATARAPWAFRAPMAMEPEASAPVGPFHGNTRSGVFHRPGCPQSECQRCTRVFPTREAALAAGFKPAGDCLR